MDASANGSDSMSPSFQLSGGDMSTIHLSSSIDRPYHNSMPTSIISSKDEQPLRFFDGGFTSKFNRKPTATDRFLRFDSHHPLTEKRGLIKCLTTRTRQLCSTEESEEAEMQHISKGLQCNNYPRHFIQKCIHRAIPSSSV